MDERYGFVAEEIGRFNAFGMTPKLSAETDDLIMLSPLGGVVSLKEV